MLTRRLKHADRIVTLADDSNYYYLWTKAKHQSRIEPVDVVTGCFIPGSSSRLVKTTEIMSLKPYRDYKAEQFRHVLEQLRPSSKMVLIEVGLTAQEVFELKQFTKLDDDAEAIVNAAREFLRLSRSR